MTSTSTETVVFDVGGTTYKVSRSLINKHPKTMLARMISEMWDTKDNSKPIFIEWDGERFKYCLDYMRDAGIVTLPYSIPKAAFLQDLAYYGFEGVDPESITIVGTLQANVNSRTMFDSLLKAEETRLKYQTLALFCARKIYEKGNLIVDGDTNSAAQNLSDAKHIEFFNTTLSVFGLKFNRRTTSGYGYQLHFEFI